MRRLLGFLSVALLAMPSHGMYWDENFDTFPKGAVSDRPGWTYRFGLPASRGGAVVEGTVRSTPHALALPTVPVATTRSVAVYNDLAYSNAAGKDSIIRVSVHLYRENLNQDFRMHLGKDDTALLTLRTDDDGSVVLGTVDSNIPFPTGSYVVMTMFYDMESNQACLTYGGLRIIGWRDVGTTAFNEFNMIWFERKKFDGVTDSGSLLLDNVSVQTIPKQTWAWWRFDLGDGNTSMEETSRFDWKNYRTAGGAGSELPTPCLRTLSHGLDTVRNHFVRRGSAIPAVRPMVARPAMNFWTVEMIFKLTGSGPVHLFEWAEGLPPASTTGSWIKLLWVTAEDRLDVTLRDNAETGVATWFRSFPGMLVADGQWHHLALVKAGAFVELFVDYDLKQYLTLGAVADEAYSFSSASRVAIGMPLDDETAYPRSGFRVDEVRVSSAATQSDYFLQLAQPVLTAGPSDGSSWFLRFAGHPTQTYRILQRAGLSPGSWSEVKQASGMPGYIGNERHVTLPAPTSGSQRFYRLESVN